MVDSVRETIEKNSDPRTGFLPSRTPIHQLPGPFSILSKSCGELSGRYHGEGLDCRPWLDEFFGHPMVECEKSVKELDRLTQEALMTQLSLLCHAYRWQGMPTSPLNYQIKSIQLPSGLESLWTQVARLLGIPRVGIFYTMISNNWRLIGKPSGSLYDPEEITDEKIDLIHSWLHPPEHEELRTFVVTALAIESRGQAVLQQIQRVFQAIIRENNQEVTFGLLLLESHLLRILSTFNNQIRKMRIRPASFLRFVQPTMIWLLDHGEGPLEGASGPQSCTVQAIDSFLGVPRDSALGSTILKSRKYMLPHHRALLQELDRASSLLPKYVESSKDYRLRQTYNRCVQSMISWRTSHQKRGAVYIKGDPEDKVANYTSTGLVIEKQTDQVQAYEKIMDQHIEETKRKVVEDLWKGRERSFDYLFRYLSEDAREELRGKLGKKNYHKKQVIIRKGERFPGLYMIHTGKVAVGNFGEADELKIIAELPLGEIFGEMSLVENSPASTDVVAIEETVLEHLSITDLYELISDHPSIEGSIYISLAQILSHRLRAADDLLIRAPTSFSYP